MGLFKSAISKFRKGLEKTRHVLAMDVRELLPGRRLDEALLSQVEASLIKADMGAALVGRIMANAREAVRAGELSRGEDLIEFLKRELKALWPPETRTLRELPPGVKPRVILVTGVNGSGKTTSIAKLCALLRSQNRTVLLAACDTFRAGAVRQLEVWGERLGVQVVKGQQGGDPASVAFDAAEAAVKRGVDDLIIDTAGRLQTQDPLMRQLTKIRGVIGRRIEGAPHEVLLVLDATAGQNALRQAEEFQKAAGVTGIFLAKLDGTARGGVVVAIKSATDIPVKFVGVGETPDDVEAFDPAAFVEALLGE